MLALSLRGLSKTYPNNFRAVGGIDWDVKQGEFWALLGSNGAGKSTTIGIISSLINKSSGSVSIMGIDMDKFPQQTKKFIGLVPQEFNFNVWEPLEEILINQAGYYGIERKLAKQRAEFYLKKLTLWEKRGEIARNLSGGMKRRLMIARALVHEPKLLILDEPTAGVDVEVRRVMWDFLKEISGQGVTIILTTHYLEEAEHLCEKIAIIDEGLIIEKTSMKTLLNQLDKITYVLHLQKPIVEAPKCSHFKMCWVDETTLEVDCEKGQALNLLFQRLDELGIRVLSIKNKHNRLEKLFMNLVSKKENKNL